MTQIAIIGTGSMARELGKGWAKAGHQIVYGSRDALRARSTGSLPSDDIRDYSAAIDGADVVLIAIPFPKVAQFARAHRGKLAGKVVIDITNPFDHLSNNERAGAEFTADALGSTNGLVAAFKDNFAATINAPLPADGRPADVKLAADDPAAREVAARLAQDLGHRPLDCGPLRNARFLDGMVSLMLDLDRRYAGFSQETGWRFVGLASE